MQDAQGRSATHLRSRRELLEGLTGVASPLPGPRRFPRQDPVRTLVNRITYGFEREEYLRAKALGYEAYLEEQLDHLSIDDSDIQARLAGYGSLGLSPKELFDQYWTNRDVTYRELKGARLLRAVYSKRQLYERMVELWSDHFNIDHQEDLMWLFMAEDHRTVARQHALGSFPAMLSASAHSGAMLYYLDNWLNYAGTPQENYARELMELHTLSVDGGYTEPDVREVAKCLTGWRVVEDQASPDFLRFWFDPTVHEPGPKTVLGQTIQGVPAEQEGVMVLDLLAQHPGTAAFVARKMIRWLLTEHPPQALVDQVAQIYLDTSGDIRAMLRVVLAKENMSWASPVLTPKLRRPFHLMASILRGLRAEITDPARLIDYLALMGHSPFDWSQPNGYPDRTSHWDNSLLPRWIFLNHLLEGSIPGVKLAFSRHLAAADGSGTRPDGLARRINRRLLGRALSPDEERGVQRFVDSLAPGLSRRDVGEAIGLAASAPGYQWY